MDTDSLSSRPNFYRAPTWSWAAIDGPINYNAAFYNPIASELVLSAIDVLDTHTETPGLDQFGEVTRGWIRLTGCLKPAYFKKSSPRTIYECYNSDIGSGEVIGDYYDDIKQPRDDETLFCLRLSIFPFTQGPSIPITQTVLVLQPTSGITEEYRRVGAGTIHNTDWFENWPRTTITII